MSDSSADTDIEAARPATTRDLSPEASIAEASTVFVKILFDPLNIAISILFWLLGCTIITAIFSLREWKLCIDSRTMFCQMGLQLCLTCLTIQCALQAESKVTTEWPAYRQFMTGMLMEVWRSVLAIEVTIVSVYQLVGWLCFGN